MRKQITRFGLSASAAILLTVLVAGARAQEAAAPQATASATAGAAPVLTKEQQYLNIIMQLQSELAKVYQQAASCEANGSRSHAYQQAAQQTQQEFLKALDAAGLRLNAQTGMVERKAAPSLDAVPPPTTGR